MIYQNTRLITSDNSGVLSLLCIKILTKSKTRTPGLIGDLIVLSVKKFKKNLKSTKIKYITSGLNKQIGDRESRIRGLIVKTKKNKTRFGNYIIKFNINSVIILDRQFLPWGTRIFGTITEELNQIKYGKIYSLGTYYQ